MAPTRSHAYRLFMAPGMGHCGGGQARTSSNGSPRSSSGLNTASRRLGSWRHIRPTAWSTARVRCARIRKSRDTAEREAPTMRPTFRASRQRRNVDLTSPVGGVCHHPGMRHRRNCGHAADTNAELPASCLARQAHRRVPMNPSHIDFISSVLRPLVRTAASPRIGHDGQRCRPSPIE